MVRKKQGVDWGNVPSKKRSAFSLSNKEVLAIAKLALLLEEKMGRAQDIEWAIDADATPPDNIVLLQTRPAHLTIKKPESATDRMIDMIVQKFYRP